MKQLSSIECLSVSGANADDVRMTYGILCGAIGVLGGISAGYSAGTNVLTGTFNAITLGVGCGLFGALLGWGYIADQVINENPARYM